MASVIRSLVIRAALAATVLVPFVAGPASAQYPTQPPTPGVLRPVRFPPFVSGRLANGLSYIIVEQHEQPVVTVNLSLPSAGAGQDPAGKEGLASLVSDVLTKGTERRTAEQIAAEVEGAGGGIGAGVSNDNFFVSLSLLAANLPAGMDVLADVLTHAAFPEREVDLARTQELSSLQLSLSQPDAVAGRAFAREVYGTHPYGRAETAASFRAITRDDVTRFYGERIRPAGALLVVAGDVHAADVRALLDRTLGAWSGAPPAVPPPPAPPVRTNTEIVLVNRPASVQSNIVAGFASITPRDPALYPIVVLNHIFGGGGSGRIDRILREQKGWTYGARASLSRPHDQGTWSANTEVRTEVTDSALAELLHQFDLLRNAAPADSEVTFAKSYLVGSFPRTIETPEQIAGAIASARLQGLPDNFVTTYRDRLAAVTRAQLTATARRYLTTDRMVIVVVGNGPRILAGLKALNLPLRIQDVDGNPLTEADLTPRTAGVAWARDRVATGTATYRILVQGNAFGEEVRTISRDGGSLRVITTTTLGPIASIGDTTTMDATTLAPLSVRQGGTAQGQAISVSLDYDGMHVRGRSHSPRPGGARDLTVDTTLAAGTIDNEQLGVLVDALPLAAGGRWTFSAFDGSEGTVRTMTASVSGEESVTTPAGTVACWRVEVNGGQIPVVYYVPKAAPFAHAKLELVGAPLVFELTARN